MNAINAIDIGRALREYPRWRARESLLEFCKYVRPGFQVNWHHEVICEYLQGWISGTIPRLMLFAPPRVGKSELVSRCLPAYLFGRFPDSEIISCSHTASLALELSTDMQGIIDSEAYQELFPHVGIKRKGSKHSSTDYRANNRFSVIGRRGKFFCCGVGGPIVGRGFDFGIIDDPIKNREEAYSPVKREKINRWYPTQFATRMLPGARILLMHQRWHVNDLAGFLQQLQSKEPNADQWQAVSFPAIGEDPAPSYDKRKPGEPLCANRYGLDYLNARRVENTESDWLAIYQQRPTADGGNHFKMDWFDRTCWVLRPGDRIAIRKPNGQWQEWHLSDCMRYGMVDPASTAKVTSDHTAMGAFLQTPDGDLCVLNIRRGKIPIDRIPQSIFDYAKEFELQWVGCEADGFQVTLSIAARRLGLRVRELSHRGKGKLVRATQAIIDASNGQVILPQEASWRKGYLERLAAFTGNDGDEDDEIDVLAYAVLEKTIRTPPKPQMPKEEPQADKPKNVPLPSPNPAGNRRLFG